MAPVFQSVIGSNRETLVAITCESGLLIDTFLAILSPVIPAFLLFSAQALGLWSRCVSGNAEVWRTKPCSLHKDKQLTPNLGLNEDSKL